jgi:hypothetical protein
MQQPMKDRKHTLKEILNGKLTVKQARQQLKQENPRPTLIYWGDNSYSFWQNRGKMTEAEVKEELGVESLDGLVMIAFS